jgi:glutaconate CoA-transferase subunit B
MPGAGPTHVITDKALFDFANAEHEMQLSSLHRGVTVEEVRAQVGWPLRITSAVGETPAPTEEELHLIRSVLDRGGLYAR